MKLASDFGFLPQNDGVANAKALQDAVNGGGDVYVSEPGVYDLADCILLDDNTSIKFCAGSYIRRQNCPNGTAFVFINRGAYNREFNENIRISGLKLICNGVVSDYASKDLPKTIIGIRGHLAFLCIKNLIIEDLECLDLPAADFCIHICNFENVVIERVHIEGRKDAVHFGRGRKFVVRHGIFKTYDDPIALNAHDYVDSNPELGWIEDGLIEDCYDLNDTDTVGFFCRILAGSWVDWYSGMQVQRGDTVVSNGRLYRVFMPPDGATFTSLTQPTHDWGTEEYDGFWWTVVQKDVLYNCGCRNLHFKNIYLKKDRPFCLFILFDHDEWSRSYYPNSIPPVQENITFENLVVEGDVQNLLASNTPVDNVRFINCTLKNNTLRFVDLDAEGLIYPQSHVLLDGTYFKEKPDLLVYCNGGNSAVITVANTMNDNIKTKTIGNVKIKKSDITIEKG